MKLTIELERATDMTEETWTSHCLEIDLVSQGSTPQDAIVMLAEAIDMMVNDEIEAQDRAGNPSPGWERAFANIADEVAKRESVQTEAKPPFTGTIEEYRELLGAKRKDTP